MAMAVFAATSAQAVTIYNSYNFDLSSTYIASSTLDQSTAGNSITFRSTTDPQLQVKATAWSIDRSGSSGTGDDIVTAATLKIWSGGLGVQNKYEPNSSPQHSIDNGVDSSGSRYMVDFVMLQFNYDVDVNNMTTGWVSGDQDASLRVGAGPTSNPALWNSALGLDKKKVFGATSGIELTDYVGMADTSLNSTTNNTSPFTRSVNGSNQHGMMWLIGALYGTQSNDFFKLDLLNVTVFPTIPEPSTWLTMILGFGFVGWSMRRKSKIGTISASLA
jgi:hypothetical protein